MKRFNRPFRVNENAVRGVALQVFILSLAALYTGSSIPVIILLADFAIRVLLIPRYSPLAWISRKLIVPISGFKRKQIVFKPKRFAAGIGMFMSAAALFFNLNGLVLPAAVTIAILALFSFLEAFFKFCAGCKIFGLLMKLGLVSEDECPDCVYGDGSGI
jgi:Domain of unknown function (DUF4395)